MAIIKRVFIVLYMLAGLAACFGRKKPTTIKDLDENMMDLRIYQENLGDLIKEGKLTDAAWLANGMDSLLQVMANTFPEHRKLSNSFLWFYNRKLKDPVKGIRKSVAGNDTAAARQHYRVLIRRCNSCHIDHDIDKEIKY